jgi:glycosyltransferase involved in cell wall biosynthesis
VAADFLALPSDFGETWGLVVNEAMACGLPALVSDRVGCGPDLVEDGVTGAVFPCGDVEALAERLRDLASNPERLRTMGRRAQERVLEGYSVQRAVAGTVEAVEFLSRQKRV